MARRCWWLGRGQGRARHRRGGADRHRGRGRWCVGARARPTRRGRHGAAAGCGRRRREVGARRGEGAEAAHGLRGRAEVRARLGSRHLARHGHGCGVVLQRACGALARRRGRGEVEDAEGRRARGAGRDAATPRSRSRAWPAAARGRRRGGFSGVAEQQRGEDDTALIGVHAMEAEVAMRVPGRGACSSGDGVGAPGSQGAWAHQQWRRLGKGGERRLGLLYASWPRVPGVLGAAGGDPRRPCRWAGHVAHI